ncbi:hypothetical protein JZ751_029968 [Albula glossodonta]|uniref:Uncharacterized protein n=1 Tax=Albula glossodonta TaxID=121402 RepID=A0A8T2NDM8_9TELE|nr:hypothetical protein JZ751_029968 [Albula glossodonta]
MLCKGKLSADNTKAKLEVADTFEMESPTPLFSRSSTSLRPIVRLWICRLREVKDKCCGVSDPADNPGVPVGRSSVLA